MVTIDISSRHLEIKITTQAGVLPWSLLVLSLDLHRATYFLENLLNRFIRRLHRSKQMLGVWAVALYWVTI
jgi:hypothetical protein